MNIFKNKKIIYAVFSVILITLFSTSVSAKTYVLNGMTFVVGEHKPKERLNPKVENKKTIIVNSLQNLNPLESEDINENNLAQSIPEVGTQIYPLEMNSGVHVTTGGVWTNASSRALKENILGIDNQVGLDTVLNLQPVTYNYKLQPGETYAGFIAEDVPEIVATSDRKSLSPMDIVAVVVGAIQKVWDKIISIEQGVTGIFDRLAVIEGKLGINNQNNNSILNQQDYLTNNNQNQPNQNDVRGTQNNEDSQNVSVEENQDTEGQNETGENEINQEEEEEGGDSEDINISLVEEDVGDLEENSSFNDNQNENQEVEDLDNTFDNSNDSIGTNNIEDISNEEGSNDSLNTDNSENSLTEDVEGTEGIENVNTEND